MELTLTLRSALFWDVTQRWVVVLYHVSGLPIGPIFKGQEVFLTFDDGTERLSRNVGTELPLNAA
jgi:hypothetical protein